MLFYYICPDGIKLLIYAQPGAKKTVFDGIYADRLKIKIGTVPQEGAANKELIKFLAKEFGLSKSRVILLKGDKSRQKEIFLKGDKGVILDILSKINL